MVLDKNFKEFIELLNTNQFSEHGGFDNYQATDNQITLNEEVPTKDKVKVILTFHKKKNKHSKK